MPEETHEDMEDMDDHMKEIAKHNKSDHESDSDPKPGADGRDIHCRFAFPFWAYAVR